MKNVNETQNKTTAQTDMYNVSERALSLEMTVYNEMSDQTAQSVDVVKMIEVQFEQIKYMNTKKSYLLKEIAQYFKS